MTVAGDQARASVYVEVEPAEAFETFTAEIDQWWRRGVKFRVSGRRHGVIHLEPKVGGRLFEEFDTGVSQSKVVATGTVTVWDPPKRLVFDWRGVNFRDEEKAEVEVTFVPQRTGTLVTVTHRGWAAIRPDHPARHGQPVGAFIRSKAMWWGEQLTSLRILVKQRPRG